MLKANISLEFAMQLETGESDAWFDFFNGQNSQIIQQFKLTKQKLGSAAMLFSPVIQFSHFNQVMGFGLSQPATESELDEILSLYQMAQINRIELHVIPHSQPNELKEWMSARNLRKISSWDRVFRKNEPLLYNEYQLPGMSVEKVTEQTIDEWSTFLVNMYNLQPTKQLAECIAMRQNWHHYILHYNGRIMAIRSQYISPNGVAWWGIEAPVPGLMTPRFDFDHHICGEMIRDGLQLGVKLFVGEIEAVSPALDNDGYLFYDKLGFKYAYLRENYSF